MVFKTPPKTETVRDILLRVGNFEVNLHTHVEPRPTPAPLVLDDATKATHYAQAVDRLGIGELYHDAYFGSKTERPTMAQEDAKAWAERIKAGDKSKSFLLMIGNCGTGKTHSGISALLDLGVSFQAIGFENPEWVSHVKARYFTHHILAESVMRTTDGYKLQQAMLTTPVLMLDDLRAEGTGRVSDALVAWMDALIDHRYRHCLPTIITANTTSEQFRITYGQKVEDRLIQSGEIIQYSSPSLRKKGGYA